MGQAGVKVGAMNSFNSMSIINMLFDWFERLRSRKMYLMSGFVLCVSVCLINRTNSKETFSFTSVTIVGFAKTHFWPPPECDVTKGTVFYCSWLRIPCHVSVPSSEPTIVKLSDSRGWVCPPQNVASLVWSDCVLKWTNEMNDDLEVVTRHLVVLHPSLLRVCCGLGENSHYLFAHRRSWHRRVLRLINRVGGCWLLIQQALTKMCLFSQHLHNNQHYWFFLLCRPLFEIFRYPDIFSILKSSHLKHIRAEHNCSVSVSAPCKKRRSWDQVFVQMKLDATIAAVWWVPVNIFTMKKREWHLILFSRV